MSETDAKDELLAARKVRAAIAREDAGEFAAFVLRDERTGVEVEPQAMHMQWHMLADRHPRFVLWSFVESAKTQQMSVARTLWKLGRDPSRRIAIISNTFGQAQKIIRTLAQYIERSDALHEVFPDLLKGEPWTANALTVRRGTQSKDYSVQACGVHGNITGARLDDVILDDVLDFENTRTHAMRQDLYDWYYATIVGRLTEYATVLAIGTAYHPDDLLHRFASPTSTFRHARFPVLDSQGNSVWRARWPLHRINARRLELGTAEFSRQMLCKARDDDASHFRQEWLDVCLKRGEGLTLLDRLDIIPHGFATFTGVDLGVSLSERAGKTAIFTILLHSNGVRQVLNIESGKWSGPEIVRRIISTHERYHSIVYVENVGAQEFLLQFAREHSAVPIRPFTTGNNKAHPEFGVEGLAIEMQNAKWIIPGGSLHQAHPEVQAWLNELLDYSPSEHTGDSLMASWFAREGARRFSNQHKAGVGVRIIGKD